MPSDSFLNISMPMTDLLASGKRPYRRGRLLDVHRISLFHDLSPLFQTAECPSGAYNTALFCRGANGESSAMLGLDAATIIAVLTGR